MQALDVISATELGQYRLCRRRWLYDREQKIPPKTIPTALWMGSAAHVALQHYYVNNRTVEDMTEGLRHGVAEQMTDLVDNQGFCREAVLADVDAHYGQLSDILMAYEPYDKDVTQPPWTVLETERRYHLDLGPDVPPLTGQLDLIATAGNDLIIVDHKLYGRTPDQRSLHLDTQMTAYAFIVWKVYGQLPSRCILNVLIKKKPSITVRAPRAGASPWQGRFARLETERSLEAVQSFEARTVVQMRDMVHTAREPELAYPNPGWQCPSCGYYAHCLDTISGATGDGGIMPWEEEAVG